MLGRREPKGPKGAPAVLSHRCCPTQGSWREGSRHSRVSVVLMWHQCEGIQRQIEPMAARIWLSNQYVAGAYRADTNPPLHDTPDQVVHTSVVEFQVSISDPKLLTAFRKLQRASASAGRDIWCKEVEYPRLIAVIMGNHDYRNDNRFIISC